MRGKPHTIGAAALSLRRAFDVSRTALIMKTSYTLILFNWSPDVTGCRYLVALIFALKEKTLAFRYVMTSILYILYLDFQEGNKDGFSSPNSALTPPLATLGKKPPLPYCPWKEGQAFGSGHSLHSSSRLCLASTGRPLIGDS